VPDADAAAAATEFTNPDGVHTAPTVFSTARDSLPYTAAPSPRSWEKIKIKIKTTANDRSGRRRRLR